MSHVLLPCSERIEQLLVRKNLRGMQRLQQHLQAGYVLRSAQLIADSDGVVFIGTGFPVENTFETDGPVGAIALYHALESLGLEPVIVCGPPLSSYLRKHFRVHPLIIGPHASRKEEAAAAIAHWQPTLMISIERPGMSFDGHYYNMRGEQISHLTACFDSFFDSGHCSTIAIGDGGNEIGMGKVAHAVTDLPINLSATDCHELIPADVSNWGAYGLIGMLECLTGKTLLSQLEPQSILQFLRDGGSVDGVTRANTLTEDGLDVSHAQELLTELKTVSAWQKHALRAVLE